MSAEYATAILKKARKAIVNPENWCTHNQGLDSAGNYVGPLNPKTVQRCAYGALFYAVGEMSEEKVADAAKMLSLTVMGEMSNIYDTARVCEYNNKSTHEQVMAWFDRAIELSKEW